MLQTALVQSATVWTAADAYARLSPYHLAADQIRSFDQHGFL